MKAQITIGIAVVFAVIVGGFSMGCIDAPDIPAAPEIPDVVDIPTVTPEVITVVEVVEVIVVDVTESEVEVITYKYYPVLVYSRCFPLIPENVAGFDTPMERAYILQAELNNKMDLLYNGMVQQRYQYRGEQAYTEFYQGYYQDKLDKYTKMYCTVGNKVIGDFEIVMPLNISLNCSA